MGIKYTCTDSLTPCRAQEKHSMSYRFSAIVGLQFLTAAAFGFMSPIISIVMTEYFARFRRNGLAIDCGANPHDEDHDKLRGSQGIMKILFVSNCRDHPFLSCRISVQLYSGPNARTSFRCLWTQGLLMFQCDAGAKKWMLNHILWCD
ncbi:hypothetical protein DD238_002904 [Peronospora effusa]|uniref:Uncharacterized protein n=1 Tax=Peronospora effusa TaxID=542832 RepID=A0A3M6VJ39_9STRA|nr:hypothetical protein DD238_002904 [Peronospora effusa]RQM14930.1 hypothetical protein DD237_003337 [Peronospora effusa]